MDRYRHIVFIANPVEIDEDVTFPFDLGEGYFIDRANEEEVQGITQTLGGSSIHFPQYRRFYQNRSWQPEQMHNPANQLPQKDWRYIIVWIETERPPLAPGETEALMFDQYGILKDLIGCIYLTWKAFMPMKMITKNGSKKSTWYDPLIGNELYTIHGSVNGNHILTLSNRSLARLKEVFAQFRSAKNGTFASVTDSILTFNEAARTPIYSRIKIIELFSIIELLISHKPAENDSYGSITRQVSNKLNLINNRLKSPFAINTYFDPSLLGKDNKENRTETARIISKLYSYRSNVAHGSTSDFEKELKALKNPNAIIAFLEYDMIPKLLTFALSDPQLIYDIKLC